MAWSVVAAGPHFAPVCSVSGGHRRARAYIWLVPITWLLAAFKLKNALPLDSSTSLDPDLRRLDQFTESDLFCGEVRGEPLCRTAFDLHSHRGEALARVQLVEHARQFPMQAAGHLF